MIKLYWLDFSFCFI